MLIVHYVYHLIQFLPKKYSFVLFTCKKIVVFFDICHTLQRCLWAECVNRTKRKNDDKNKKLHFINDYFRQDK